MENKLTKLIQAIPADRFSQYLPAVIAISQAFKKKERIIVAIDGRTASGKTSFVEWLSKFYDLNVYHMDDFFLRPEQRTQSRLGEAGGNVDRERFNEEVLLPLISQSTFTYGKYSCKHQVITNQIRVERKSLEIIEGAYSHHPDLVYAYDLKIVFSLTKEEQIKRLIKRNGPDNIEDFIQKWIPMEEEHLKVNGVMTDAVITCEDIVEVMRSSRSNKALSMEKYLKNQFTCLGVMKNERQQISNSFMKSVKRTTSIHWDFVFYLWDLEGREYQYIAIEYLILLKNRLEPKDIPHLKRLILEKSWWDTVDSIASHLLSHLLYVYKNEVEGIVREWAKDDNIWICRSSILAQLKYKDATDTELLEFVILNNISTKEFFINKAIGWALREYSKSNPIWVKQWIEENELSKLSRREASKYI